MRVRVFGGRHWGKGKEKTATATATEDSVKESVRTHTNAIEIRAIRCRKVPAASFIPLHFSLLLITRCVLLRPPTLHLDAGPIARNASSVPSTSSLAPPLATALFSHGFLVLPVGCRLHKLCPRVVFLLIAGLVAP